MLINVTLIEFFYARCLREEGKLQVSWNMVVRLMFGPVKEEIIHEYNEESQHLFVRKCKYIDDLIKEY